LHSTKAGLFAAFPTQLVSTNAYPLQRLIKVNRLIGTAMVSSSTGAIERLTQNVVFRALRIQATELKLT
jgi:hypothetical protein